MQPLTTPVDRSGKRVALNAATAWAAAVAKNLLQLVIIPFLISTLGKESYGLIGIVMSIVAFTALADFGLRRGLTRHMSARVAAEDTEGFNRLASSALALYLAVASVLAVAVYAAAPLLCTWFKVSDALIEDAVFVIRLYGSGAILIAFVLQVHASTLNSHERFDMLNYTNTGLGVVSASALLVVLSVTDSGVRGWAVVMLSSRAVHLFTVAALAKRIRPSLKLSVSLIDRRTLGPVFTLGGLLFLGQMANLLMQNADPFILTTVLGLEAVSVYKPAVGLAAVARPFVMTLARQLNPRATALHVTEDSSGLRDVLVLGTKYTFLLGIAAVTVLFFLAQPIMQVWVGSSLGDDATICAQLLMIWCVHDLFVYAGGTQWSVLVAMERVRYPVSIYFPFSILNVVANYLVLKYSGLGIAGIVIPTVCFEFTGRILVVRYAAKSVGMTASDYAVRALWPGAKVLAACAVVAWLVRTYLPMTSVVPLLIGASIIALAWLGATWTLAFDEKDRARFLRVAKKFRGSSRT